jgi:hypothetical protein
MKRKLISLMLTGVMVAGLAGNTAVFAAAQSETESVESVAAESEAESTAAESEAESAQSTAEEEPSLKGLVDMLLSDDGPLKEMTESGSEVGELLGGLISELEDPDSELSAGINKAVEEIKTQAEGLSGKISEVVEQLGVEIGEDIPTELGGLIRMFAGEDGSLDLDSVRGIVDTILGRGSEGELDIEAKIREMLDSDEIIEDPFDEAVTDYIVENYAKFYEPSDISIVVPVIVGLGDGKVLGDYWLLNFDVDGSNLVFKSGGVETGILNVTANEDETEFTITGAEIYEDEELYEKLPELCEQVGITADDYFNTDRNASVGLYDNIIDYAKMNKAIKTFEEAGEVYTIEQAKDYIVNYFMTKLAAQGEKAE